MTIRIFLGLLALFFCGDYLAHKHTRGFSLSNISSNRLNHLDWEIPLLSFEEERHVSEILDQKFTFLDKGTQSYVLVSEDKNYVLKFLKEHTFRPTIWLSFFPFSTAARRDFEKKKQSEKETLTSLKNAFVYFKKETALEYVHLNKTSHLKKVLWAVDKKGKTWKIPLDNVTFVLQRRTEKIYPTLSTLMDRKDFAGAQQILTSLLDLLRHFAHSGVRDNDPVVKRNFGVVNGEVVQIDIGRLLLGPPRPFEEALLEVSPSLKRWLENHHPELVAWVTDEFAKG